METLKIDIAIVGAGIIGMSTAYYIKQVYPQLEVVLFEKEKFTGEHSSSRNSGVLHCGIYYPTNSLKHRFCLKGIDLWYEFAKKHQIPFLNCGKYIVSNHQDNELERIYQQGEKNSVKKIRFANQDEIQTLSQYVHLNNAIYSGHTGILDISSAIKFFENELFKLNVPIMKETLVENLEKTQNHFEISFSDYKVQAQKLINCAGLGAIDLRKKLNLNDFENYYVKGNYLKYSKKLPIKSLIYPIPEKNLMGLGVHSTFDIQGDFKFGPNTERIDKIHYSMNQDIKRPMVSAIKKTFKDIDETLLHLDYAGIRSKIKKVAEEDVYPDFYIGFEKDHSIKDYTELLGIDSPGVTSSLALAQYITENI